MNGATLGVYYDEDCTDPVSRNGEPYTTVSDDDGMAIFYGLADGTYYVKEIEAPIGYVLSDEVLEVVLGEELNDSGYVYDGVFANMPEYIDVSGSKTWDDSDNQDGKRPESITIRLLADGVAATDADGNEITATVTAEDDWRWSFTDLLKYNEGEEIKYTITEDDVSDYTPEIDGYDVTNSYTPGKTGINVQKFWDDSDNQDDIRPSEITVVLVKNGEETDQTLTLNEDNDWSGNFTDLDEYTDGEKNDYTVAELDVAGYDSVVAFVEGTSTINITNTHTPEPVEPEPTPESGTISVTGFKTWVDDNNAEGTRPESITITLKQNGAEYSTKQISAEDSWTWTFDDLPEFDDDGNRYTYTVSEGPVEGYYDSDAYAYNFTNVQEDGEGSGTGSLIVTKVVAGDGASSEDSFTFTVRLSDTSINGTYGEMEFTNGVATFELKHGESKTATGLPEGITYRVSESNYSGYSPSSTLISGTIAENKLMQAAFTNNKVNVNYPTNSNTSGGGGSGRASGNSGPGATGTVTESEPSESSSTTINTDDIGALPYTGESNTTAILMGLCAVFVVLLGGLFYMRRKTPNEKE